MEEEVEEPQYPVNLNSPNTKAKLKRYLDRVPSELESMADQLGLEIGDDVELSEFVYLGSKTTRLGNRVTKPSTLCNYENIWRHFWFFCAYIGDYESMLILLLPPPPFVPPMRPETLELFLQYRYHPTNSPLNATDVFGNTMLAEGGWNNPKKEWAFSASIADLHEHHKHKGVAYEDVCSQCLSLPKEERPCRHHEQRGEKPRLVRVGDPTRTSLYLNAKKRCQQEGKKHKEQGSAALLPVDLRMLRTHLLSVPVITNLQTWVISLVSTLLFLRYDEFGIMHGDHFLPELFKIPRSTETVESLALKVKGKADEDWVELCMFADHENPGLCGPRFLLVYLYLIGWKGGSIFPHEKELHDPPADGHYRTTLEYGTFLKQVQDLCKKVLIKRKNTKIGLHSWRKTAYTLAIFGRGVRDDIKLSARHSLKSPNSATYSRDAERSYEDHLRCPNPLNNVREWKCIRISSTDHSGVMSTLNGSHYVIQVSRESNKSIATANLQLPMILPQKSPATLALPEPQKKKRKVAGDNDLAERHSLNSRRMSTEEQINVMLEVHKKRNDGKLTSAARTWASRSLDPTISCLENHFGGDVAAFARKYPKYMASKFKKECCNGLGEGCSP